MLSNLPPGVTDRMVDDAYGEDCFDDCDAYDENGDWLEDQCQCEARREAMSEPDDYGPDYDY